MQTELVAGEPFLERGKHSTGRDVAAVRVKVTKRNKGGTSAEGLCENPTGVNRASLSGFTLVRAVVCFNLFHASVLCVHK